MTDPLSIAGSIAGLVAIADSIFTRIYRYSRAVRGAKKDIQELGTRIRELSGILHGLEVILNELENDCETSGQNPRLHHVNSCRNTLLKIQNHLDAHKFDNSSTKLQDTFKKWKWPFSETETKSLLDELEQHKTTLDLAIGGENLAAILKGLSRQDQIASDVKVLKEAQVARWAEETHIRLNNKRKEVLRFFEKANPIINHHTNRKLHHALTGLWLTEGATFKSWMYTRNSKLWLSGIPGAGKSVLASCVIEEALKESNERRAVAYFYCDYKDPVKQNPINILNSLAAQLARQNENVYARLEKVYDKFHPGGLATIALESSDMVDTFVQLTTSFEDVTIIVDALDECSSYTVEVVNSLVNLTSTKSQNVRTLFLSRDEYDIRQLLQDSYGHIEIAAHREDLELYVASEIELRQKKYGREQLRIKSADLKEYLKTTLVERAKGM